jgi:hypothetical protein
MILDIENPLSDHDLNYGRAMRFLAGYEPFSGSTNWFDLVRPSKTGVFVGAPTWRDSNRPGGRGVIDFAGGGHNVEIGALTGSLQGGLTYGVWLYSGPEGGSGFDRVVTNADVNPGISYGSGNIWWSTNSGVNSSFAYTSNLWYRALGTSDGTTQRLYINGREVSSGASDSIAVPGDLRLANRAGLDRSFVSQLDDATVWLRMLSAAEALADWETSQLPYDPTLNWRRPASIFDMGGGASYNETGAGNITLGGSASVQVTYSPAASGGAILGGSALPQVTSSQSGAGGLVAGGAASVQATYSPAAAGGLAASGTASVQATYSPAAAGGVVIGGAADLGAAEYTETGSGGAALGGTALVQAEYSPAASGGVVIGGAADLGNQEFNEVASGGLVASGSADVQQTSSLAGSGGLILSGTAGVEYIASVLGSGGASLGGVAIVSASYALEASGGVVLGGTALVADFISIAKFPGAVRIERVGPVCSVEMVGPRSVLVSRVGPGKVTVSRRTL